MTSSHKLLAHPQALCNMVRRIAVAAGHLTLDYFDGFADAKPETKADGSPVTAADRVSEAHILPALAELLPGIPIIAEEQAATNPLPDIAGHEYFWLVDPLD